MNKKQKQEVLDWASNINVNLLDAFYNTFYRDITTDDVLEVHETELFNVLTCNGRAFAVVSNMGAVYEMSHMGYTNPAYWNEQSNKLEEMR